MTKPQRWKTAKTWVESGDHPYTVPNHRRFDNKMYMLQFVRPNKSDAVGLKSGIHHSGGLARVVKTKSAYIVYSTYDTTGMHHQGRPKKLRRA